MNLVLRTADPGDAGDAGGICHAAFRTIAERHAFPPDFPEPAAAIDLIEHLLSRDDVYGVTAEADGRIVGSNFLWEGEDVAGVGPITIDPAVQNGRIGRRLMEAIIERARDRGISRIRLVQAAYHSRSLALYTSLGFQTREPLSVMQGPPLAMTLHGPMVRAGVAADLKAAELLCERVHGHRRTVELRVAIEQGVARIVERGDRLTGYTTGVGFFGHTVGEDLTDVQALIAAAASFEGPGFLLPTRNASLMRWCLQHGLRIVQPMTLMTIGPYQDPQGAFLPSILY